MLTSREARTKLVEALELDLIGPDNNHHCSNELLPESPFKWYLTGYLMPTDAPEHHRRDPEVDEEIGNNTVPVEPGNGDDNNQPTDSNNSKSFLPSSMGVSVLVPTEAKAIVVKVEWGDYLWESEEQEPSDAPGDEEHGYAEAKPKKQKGYRRESREEEVTIVISDLIDSETKKYPVPNSLGLDISAVSTEIKDAESLGLVRGSKTISIFLANYRQSNERLVYQGCAFQAKLELSCITPFLNQPDLRGLSNTDNQDRDELLNDLQYRDIKDYAVGHGVATIGTLGPDGECNKISTTWIPQHEVELVSPTPLEGIDFRMQSLADYDDVNSLAKNLQPLVDQYRVWITEQEKAFVDLSAKRRETATTALGHAKASAEQIEKGIESLMNDKNAFQAFRIANKAMSRSVKQRLTHLEDPAWRPFQIAFILQNLTGIVDPTSNQRENVDLLFFPTGGGKTEAYLGLSAFSLVLRRLRKPGISYAGVCVLMRYTLRLLTLDQLGRAACLICALELEREKNDALGKWPFEIGLWVGSAATPNRLGARGYKGPGAQYTAHKKLNEFRKNSKRSSPIPLENCPWCNEKFDKSSFKLTPNENKPENLEIKCSNRKCEFHRDRPLPILSVDEPIYRRLPCFLIATVDKFAALPWEGSAGALLGHVNQYDSKGFYGASEPNPTAQGLSEKLDAPDLIIQDELHLISGPLGTIAGVYETAIEKLATREVDGLAIKPKIVASTATARRAREQIQALFGRSQSSIFPPQGPDIKDSFFAQTKPIEDSNGRLYIGVAAQGKSLKVVLMRTALAIACTAKKLYEENGGKANTKNPLDPYMTLMGYFNSLRELGGSRRIIEDEVVSRAYSYGARVRRQPQGKEFYNRTLDYEPKELTSRVSTSEVADTKSLLELEFSDNPKDKGRPVDIALATNMISVGLDITRLGLMMVLGQPKGTAEYIQATSRVGRDKERPGLVISLLNIHKPRDRSHYEHFSLFHKTFYRSVEASSVTPFSPRALDRALAAALVGVCRHQFPELSPSLGAGEVNTIRGKLNSVANLFADRCQEHRSGVESHTKAKVLHRCQELLDDWVEIQRRCNISGLKLRYQNEKISTSNSVRLLHDFLSQDLPQPQHLYHKFRANRSMRDVEPSVKIRIKKLNE